MQRSTQLILLYIHSKIYIGERGERGGGGGQLRTLKKKIMRCNRDVCVDLDIRVK